MSLERRAAAWAKAVAEKIDEEERAAREQTTAHLTLGERLARRKQNLRKQSVLTCARCDKPVDAHDRKEFARCACGKLIVALDCTKFKQIQKDGIERRANVNQVSLELPCTAHA